jgi:hypothetical protein
MLWTIIDIHAPGTLRTWQVVSKNMQENSHIPFTNNPKHYSLKKTKKL